MKKVATINDLSAFGKCSLTATIPVLSVMGVTPCPVPTAVLSCQTGYDSFYLKDCTDVIEPYIEEWKKNHFTVDGIYTGFLSGNHQIHMVRRFMDAFRTKDTFVLVDPVLGDDGQAYPMTTPEFCENMKQLVTGADLITPNLTEACLLTGISYQSVVDSDSKQELLQKVEIILQQLEAMSKGRAVVTGVLLQEDGQSMMSNVYLQRGKLEYYQSPHLGSSYSGTGDLFASILCGALMNEMKLGEAIALATDFLHDAIVDTMKEHTNRNDGVAFEYHLLKLVKQEAGR
ncbi:MAG: pyridoxamine kinase [Lachnospiraceae bacterium]